VRKILFQLGKLSIPSYAAMLYLGILIGIFVEDYFVRRAYLNSTRILIATFVLLFPALVGARLLFVVSHVRKYREQPTRIWRSSEGGSAMYGGLLLAVPLSVPILQVMHIPIGVFWDLACFPMLIGAIFARCGCLLSGCCAGKPTESWFGLNLPDHNGTWRRRFPTQILEALWTLTIFSAGLAVWGHLPFPGALFLFAVGTYSAGRFLLESMRAEQTHVFGIALQRLLSVVLFAASVIAFAASKP
jgi:phosphatidylglycerol---prolipoprotein diacylglyceryl transferase